MRSPLVVMIAALLSSAATSMASAEDSADDVDARIAVACPGIAVWKARISAQARPARPPPTLPKLRETLLVMSAADQAVREPMMRGTGAAPDADELAAMRKTDTENLASFKRSFRRLGLPTATQVGADGAEAAFLIVQHADDLPFQQLVLGSMLTRVQAHEAAPEAYALLFDRTRMYQGQPQRYGSQFDEENGVTTLWRVEDPAGLDARREAMHLPPMADYACTIETVYGRKVDLSTLQVP